jgi:Flp pilus assembly protein TadG
MRLHIQRVRRARQRRGIVLAYLSVACVVLIGLMGLAVDLGRAETAKTELQRAADSAARAGAEVLLSSNYNTTQATAVITEIMNNSIVDGIPMTSTSSSTSKTGSTSTSASYFDPTSDIVYGNWDSSAKTWTPGGSPTNAVEVFANHSSILTAITTTTTSRGRSTTTTKTTTGNGGGIPLLFSAVLGVGSVGVSAHAVGAIVNLAPAGTNDTDLNINGETVKGGANPWLAGAPAYDDTLTPAENAGRYASSPELEPASTSYVNSTSGDATPSNIFQNTTGNTDHKWEYDVADPSGATASNGEPSESPTEVVMNNGQPVPLQAGDVIQVNVPTVNPNTGAANLINNDGSPGTTPIYDATGSVKGTAANPYEDVGAIPPGDTADMQTYGAYANDPQPSNTTDSDPAVTAKTTNLDDSSSDDDLILGTENNMTNIKVPIDSMVGVFLPPVPTSGPNSGVTSPLPFTGSTPPGYDFTNQSARDYTTLSPQTQQVFYVGNGQTSTGTQQSIVVPTNAAGGRLYLGTMDGQEWSNNIGQFGGITINFLRVELVQ